MVIRKKIFTMTTPSRSPATLPYKIGFIGAGQMALALAKGFMASGLLAPSQVLYQSVMCESIKDFTMNIKYWTPSFLTCVTW